MENIITAVIPYKPINPKSRLSKYLSLKQREQLS